MWSTAPERLTVDMRWPPPTGSRWAGCGRRDPGKGRRSRLERRSCVPDRNGIEPEEVGGSVPRRSESDTTVTTPCRRRTSGREQRAQRENSRRDEDSFLSQTMFSD